jgi:hypothetical protein
MKKPKPTNEYEHGQMMGMLTMLMLFEEASDEGVTISPDVLNKIKDIAAKDLSGYLEKPEEDVYLMISRELEEIS